MDAPREIELKLQCEGADLTELARHPFLHSAEPEQAAFLTSTYYDTAAGDLREAGLSLRVRREGEAYLQTVKVASAGAGLFDRPEWEGPVADAQPDLAQLADTPVPALLDAASDPILVPLFTTLVERRSRAIAYGASRIAVAFDQGRIETPNGDAPLWELELELAEGRAEDLFTLAQALAETVPLRLGALSKSARGFALVDGTFRRPSKAGPVRLAPKDTAGDAFRAIAQACLAQLRRNEDVFLHNHDPEALHQLRVALRRLRSAFTLFKPVLAQDSTAAHLRAEIKRVTDPFGHARNLDVFLAETLPAEIAKRPDEPGLEDLQVRLEAERARAYDAVLAILESQEWRSLILDLAGWLESGAWRTLPDAAERDRPAEAYAADVLDRARKRIAKRGRHLDRLDPEARHRVRIEAKKLRYGADFFASLFADKKARKRHKAFAAALSDLQDHLGALNDQATAHTVLASLVVTPDHPPVASETLFAAGLAAADNEADARKLLKAAAEAHGDLMDVKPFWR